VEDIGPVSDQVFVRGGVFCDGAADKRFLIVTVATSESLITAIAYDWLTVAVMVTVAALSCAIVHQVFFMTKRDRASVNGRENVFGASSVNGTVEMNDFRNGFLSDCHAKNQ